MRQSTLNRVFTGVSENGDAVISKGCYVRGGRKTGVDTLRPGQVRFRVHAPDPDDRDEVDAAVFATKLAALVKGLKAADKAANNGVSAHVYTIAKLHTSSPTAILNEIPSPKFEHRFPMRSSIPVFEECADAVQLGSERALEYGETINYLRTLATGASKRFGYAEVWTSNDNVIRIDPFLAERAKTVIMPKAEVEFPTKPWFKGAAIGTFDGVVELVDARGSLPEIKLKLSAGGKEIDCVCRKDHLKQLGAAIKERVRITGRAIYDGSGGLPRRVEVFQIEEVGKPRDFSRWRGAFKPFDVPDWEGDDG